MYKIIDVSKKNAIKRFEENNLHCSDEQGKRRTFCSKNNYLKK